MWDLTVPGNDDHDFYIDTRVADVLVHNCAAAGTGQPFNEDQNAVIQLAKEAKQLGGLSEDEGQALRELADEEGLPYHPDTDEPYETHPGRGFGSQPHIHVGPINHIPILPGGE